MTQMYTIFGRQVGSHVLAMITLGTLAGGVTLSMGGSKAQKATSSPPINAGSPDEETFIKDFLKKADGGDEKTSLTTADKTMGK